MPRESQLCGAIICRTRPFCARTSQFMGNPNVTFPATANAVTRSDNIRQDVDMGTVRVNYRFGGPVISQY